MNNALSFKAEYLKAVVSIFGDAGKELYLNCLAGRISSSDIPDSFSLEQIEIFRSTGLLKFEGSLRGSRDSVSVNGDKDTKQAILLIHSLSEQESSLKRYESELLQQSREVRKYLRIQIVKSLGPIYAEMFDEEIDLILGSIFNKKISFETVKSMNDNVYKAVHSVISALKIDGKEVVFERTFSRYSAILNFAAEHKFPYWKKSVDVKDDKLSFCFMSSGETPIKVFLDETVFEGQKARVSSAERFNLPWAPTKVVKVEKTITAVHGVNNRGARYMLLNQIQIAV